MTAKELKLDYFQIYDVANRQATGTILLQGQFDKQGLRMQLALLDFFANPVAKNAEPIYDKNAHLTWYRGVQPPEPMRAVILENQFGKFENPHGERVRVARPDSEGGIGECVPQDARSLQGVPSGGRGERTRYHPQAAGSIRRLRGSTGTTAVFCSSSQKTPPDEGVSHPERARPPADSCNHPAQP